MATDPVTDLIHSVLVCPQCRGSLELHVERVQEFDQTGLICRGCALLFPIVNGIPVMLIQHAQSIG